MEVTDTIHCTICGKYAPSRLERMMLDFGPRPNRPQWIEGWLCEKCKHKLTMTNSAKYPEEALVEQAAHAD